MSREPIAIDSEAGAGRTLSAPSLRLGPRAAGLLMTPGEFDDARFVAGYRYELIRGVLVVSPPPGIAERDPNDELGYLLRSYKENDPRGAALDATAPEQNVAIGDQRRRADRAVWAGLGRTPDPEADVPAILVEFVSRSKRDRRRDYEQKRGEYLAAGVIEYWVIDRFQRMMMVCTRGPSGYVERVVREGESCETPLLPGFLLPLSRLLAHADL